MSSTLQNRLVGTIIVVALVVIVLPEFIDGEKRINKQEFVDIPAVGQVVEVNSVEPFDTEKLNEQLEMPVDITNDPAVDEVFEEANADTSNTSELVTQENNTQSSEASQSDSSTNSVEQVEPLSTLDIKDSGWVVQLGSFRHEKNVKELLKTLNDAGYRAYSRPVMTSVGELTKVFVGPELEKETLELALPHLREITKLKGKITAFEVSAN